MSLLSNIRHGMEIITIDRACLGRVAFLSEPDQIGVSGHNELVPIKWVAWVDGSVYLTKTRQQVMAIWNSVESDAHRFDLSETPERQAPSSDLTYEGPRHPSKGTESAVTGLQRQGNQHDAKHPTSSARQSEAKRAGLA